MKRTYVIIGIVALLSVLATIAYILTKASTVVVHNTPATSTPGVVDDTPVATSTQPANQGTYAYQCDEHVSITLTPANDAKTILIKPIGGNYPPVSTLTYVPAKTGVRYEGGGVVLRAKGETATLGEGDSAINCSPAELPDMAPYNFGD